MEQSRLRAPAVIGRYRVESVVGVGGFGSVVRARDESLSSTVAIKILAENWSNDADIRGRFIAEARHLRRIRNPHVVTVYDIGELDDGRPYFVMEYADRGSLGDRIETRRGGQLVDLPSLARIVGALTDGVASIHAAGLVHRDLNPRNLLVCSDATDRDAPGRSGGTRIRRALLDPEERLVVGDLGLAKELAADGAPASIVGGTPYYQSPEQSDPTAGVSPAADIYALTAIVWRLMSGEAPPPAHLITSDALARLDPRWHGVMRRGLALAPEDRFGSAVAWRDAVLDALDRADASESVATGHPAPGAMADRCPYRGLASFQPDDAADFFGREEVVAELVERLREQRTLVVAGPSGSGKSSIVRAGLVRAVGAGALAGSERWPVVLMTPGADPLGELHYQLTRVATSQSEREPTAADRGRLDPHTARLAADTITDHAGGLLLCIDQFEELFTLCASAAERVAFIEVVAALVDPTGSRVRLVMAMRADFYGQAALEPWLARRITENQVLVGPMQRAELRRAVEGPAKRAGLVVDEEVVDAILQEAGADVGSLPLISHALVETWRRRTNGRMTPDAYRDAGGVSGAIAKTAEALHQTLDADSRHTMSSLLLRLVNPGEGTLDTRRRVPLDEIDPVAELPVVGRLVEARLVTAGREHIEVAHEALLSNWPRLRGWIEDSRADLRVRTHISRATAEWRDRDEDPDLVYRGSPLADAIAWRSENLEQLGPTERRFLDVSERASVEAAEKEARRERQTRRNRGLAAVAVAGVVVVAAIGLASVARVRSNERAAAVEERLVDNLGLVARLTAADDPYLALALGAEARMRGGGNSADAWTSVVASRQQLAGERLVPVGPPVEVGRALTVAVSPDGDWGAIGLDDGTLRLVATRSGEVVGETRRHDNGIEEIVFSPDGRRLASAGLDGRVLLWELSSLSGGAVVEPIDLELGQFAWSVDWSPDGSTIATASEDGVVQLWEAQTGAPDGSPLVDSDFDMLTVAFSPDGSQVIAADGLGELWAWQLPSREVQYAAVDAHAGFDIWELAFTDDGSGVVTMSSDRTATMRDAATGALVQRLFIGPNGDRVIDDVRGVTVWDDSTVLGGTDRGQIALWDLEEERVLATTGRAVSAQILDADYSVESGLILAVADDETLRRWQIDRQWPLARMADGVPEGAYGAAFLGDGSELAVGDGDGGIVILDTETARVVDHLDLGLAGRVWGLDVAPGTDLIAAGDDEGHVVLAGRDGTTRQLGGHDGQVTAVRFHAEGELVATGGREDGRVRIWRVDDGELVVDVAIGGGGVGGLAWMPEEDLLVATDAAGAAVIIALDGSTVSGPRPVSDDSVWAAAFSPDASVVAFGAADDSVTLWTADLAGDRLAAVTQLGSDGTALGFVDDGQLLVTLTRTGSVRLWDPTSGDPVGGPMVGHDGESWSLALHPDGLRFATTSTDGTVQLWDVLALDRACSVALELVAVDQPDILGPEGRLEACAERTED